MNTVAELLKHGTATLERVGIASATIDARRILAFVLGVEAGRFAGISNDAVPAERHSAYLKFIDQRALRVPVSQIVGYRDFWKYRFKVTGDVLDPRPDTEMLIEQALGRAFSRVLDLGTGTGAILLTLLLETPGATGIGTDISPEALKVARDNPLQLDTKTIANLRARRELLLSDWYDKVDGQFDLIVSNPPYIAASEMAELQPEVRDHEPHIALTPGGDGLDAYRAITARAMDFLTPGGRLIVEIGPTQASPVTALFSAAGFENIEVHPDFSGHDRVVSGKKSGNKPA